ncbi:anti-sigma-F factor Fin [Gracilibacillus timonensis]|uniref:anti-sigma-F factor Fin n=1 Tax=Gracilibacillus timonensis TaxID=1816696 RepID=UPI0008261391|nr:anti-sigma-F factor Fin [Gracilibacillus timonensis]
MTITYKCKHCGTKMASIQPHMLDFDKIGWSFLSDEEQRELLRYHPQQQVTLFAICECCQQLLEQHPQYHEVDHFIQ